VPVVATHSGGVQEILSSGGGILVERGSVVQLAGALRRLAQDPELRMRMGRQGCAVFRERFAWAQARTHVQAIEKMLSA
jgi:glycosyltransferase involved in cell wall biosynthesis